ncbi:unnamed protein product, partial [Mesorhabditis spiculigera]
MFNPDEAQIRLICIAYNISWTLTTAFFIVAVYLTATHPAATTYYKVVQMNLLCACEATDTLVSSIKIIGLSPPLG